MTPAGPAEVARLMRLASLASMAVALIFVPTIEQGPAPVVANLCACRAHGKECASKAQARKSSKQTLSFSRGGGNIAVALGCDRGRHEDGERGAAGCGRFR